MKLRDYFKVSTDYLLYGTDGDREILQKELEEKREELSKLKNKNEVDQWQLNFLDGLVQKQKEEIKELKKEKAENGQET